MQRNFYRSTTALVMTLSLLQPIVAVAQEPVTLECTPNLIAKGMPCLDPVTKLIVLPEADLKKGGPLGDVGKPEKSEPDAAAVKDAKKAEAEAARAADQAAKATDKAARAADEAAKAAAEADAAALAAATHGQSSAPNISIPDVPTVAPVTEAAQAPDSVAPTADVVTRTITRDDARSSLQEFDNSVSAAPKADSGGLTNLEKAGLLLLGAVVVGTILNNNQKVVANTGDRVVVQDQYGDYHVYKDDDVLLMQPGATVRTESFADGSTRSFVLRADGTQIVTIRDSDGRVQRRMHIGLDGLETTLIDDTRAVEPVDLRTLPVYDRSYYSYADSTDQAALRAALLAAERQPIGRTFSLRQIREIREVRDLALEINLEAITFATNSAAIPAAQAQRLGQIGNLMAELVAQDPREVFLIEGHTDAIGDPAYNLALSDRRAETVALAMAEYFGVPPENMVVQGYGERFLKVPTLDAERLNRRVAVRRITDLLN